MNAVKDCVFRNERGAFSGMRGCQLGWSGGGGVGVFLSQWVWWSGWG